MWHPSPGEESFYLILYMIVCVPFTCVGLLAITANSIRVDEARLSPRLAWLRRQAAAPASGSLVMSLRRWFVRLAGVGGLILGQGATISLSTDATALSAYGPIIYAWAAVEWIAVATWLAWLLWGFGRAASRSGTLPVVTKPPDSSTFGPDNDALWVDPQESGRGDGGNGDDKP
jgi:hypothetical protein